MQILASLLFSSLALGAVVYKTEYDTFYVTVDANGQLETAIQADGVAPQVTVVETVASAPAASSAPAANNNYQYQGTTVTVSPAQASAAPVLSVAPVVTSVTVAPAPAPSTTESSTSEAPAPAPVPTTSSSSTTEEAPITSSSSTTEEAPAPSTTEAPTSTTTSISPAPTTSQESSGLSAFAQDIVDYHNNVRAQHQVGSLTWGDDLASYAANYLSGDNCVFKHSGGPHGENIAIGYSSNDAAMDAWYDEYKDYSYSNPGFSESTGHFTQMVWKGTNRVGCATAQCSGGTFLVCEYDPPGNFLGRFAQNVFP